MPTRIFFDVVASKIKKVEVSDFPKSILINDRLVLNKLYISTNTSGSTLFIDFKNLNEFLDIFELMKIRAKVIYLDNRSENVLSLLEKYDR